MVTLVRPGESPPDSFDRSVFVACAHGTAWEAESLSALSDSGLEDGVVFVGDAAPEHAAWREAALKISDAVACWAGADDSDPRVGMAELVCRLGSSGKLFLGAGEGTVPTNSCDEHEA